MAKGTGKSASDLSCPGGYRRTCRPSRRTGWTFGEHLWRKVTGTYVFDDPGSYVVLEEACRARQRAARCAKLIDRDGELFEGNKAHPLLRDELQNRALACRLLSRLGLDLEPIKPIGPPPGGFA